MFMDDEIPKHQSQNRLSAETKVRRGGKHCPVCLAPLVKNTRRTRLMRMCVECQAHPSLFKRCRKCGQATVWENKQTVACQGCGIHGAKSMVLRE